ncbi:MAG: hypothetical protein LBU82_01645 [Treponema sp.]|nr:hypothetical protein [Treponema sp.]
MKSFVVAFTILLASCASIRAPEPFTVDLSSSRCAAGTGEAQFDKALGGIKKGEIALFYYPDEDAVCLEYRAETINFMQFWSKAGRDSFISSLEHYKEDFEQKNLIVNRSLKTRRIYDRVRGYLVWGSLGILSKPAIANTDYNIGYDFKDKSPYFTVIQRAAEQKDSSFKMTSSNIMMYFTRAQADCIADLFNQEYLRKLEVLPNSRSNGVGDFLRDLFNFK